MATKRTPQKPKPAARKPKAKAATTKRAPRRKPDPRHAPDHGFIPSDNPNQSRDH